MTVLEIILLILGVAFLVLGFFVPEKSKNQTQWEEKKEARKIDELIEKEFDGYKEKLNESLEEDMNIYLEKAERGLERISNDKIMAVNEYGDTVLADINKNHEEAVFLYSMLNDKHDDILKSQSEIENTSKDVKETLKAIEDARERAEKDFEKNRQDIFDRITETENKIELEKNLISAMEDDFQKSKEENTKPREKTDKSERKKIKRNPGNIDISVSSDNHNEEILRLYKEGKSNVAIAKELGLGVGEVKLVIDLARM